MNNKTIIELSFRQYHIKNYGDLGAGGGVGAIHLGLLPRRITPSSISIILHKILQPRPQGFSLKKWGF